MKVLVTVDVSDSHLARIRAAAGSATVVVATERAELHDQARDAEMVFGHLDERIFERAGRLRWVQTLGAGVDGVLFPDFIASDIALTSEKAMVACKH
jgi:phosphoglycerate dehydrogenase-like enzyme